MNWDPTTPLYRQLRERVVAEILQGSLAEGAMLPSVRQVASELQVNPITVSKAYQQLEDEGIVEKRRGIGMAVQQGGRQRLLEQERHNFLQNEWPAMLQRINRLGFNAQDLLGAQQ